MTAELAAAVIAGTVAMVSAGGTILSSARNVERSNANARAIEALKSDYASRKDMDQRQRRISRFSEPLARSAYDLQSRLYNFLKQNLADAYLVHGNDREKSYIINNTTFLTGQYLCWTELARRELQFIDLGETSKTGELLRLQDDIHNLWGTDKLPPLFRIFAGEQRAIGEALIRGGESGPECMGYGEFLTTFNKHADPFIDAIRQDVGSLEKDFNQASERLIRLQHPLIDLIAMLDPDYHRFPEDRRSKV